jgi:hypothetical protein
MTYEEHERLKLGTAASTLLRNLPRHKCGLSIEHNYHKNDYETVEEHLTGIEDFYKFSSEEAKAKCIETDELWTMVWYPNAPIGFINAIAAPTLIDLLLFAASLDSSD